MLTSSPRTVTCIQRSRFSTNPCPSQVYEAVYVLHADPTSKRSVSVPVKHAWERTIATHHRPTVEFHPTMLE